MISPSAMPTADAITPMTTIWTMGGLPLRATSSGDLV